MAYIPPAVHQRAARPAFVRPSGDAGAASGQPILRIVNMPPYGRTFIDGAEVSSGGAYWDGATFVYVNPPTGRSLRVVTREGETREQPNPEGTTTGAGNEFDWNTMDPVEASATALRILNGPIGGGTVWIDGQPVDPLPATPAWNGHSVNWPAGEVAVRIQTPAGEVRTAVVTVPSNLDFNAMTVMAPVTASGPRPTVDFSMGGGFNIGGAGGGSTASGFTITGIPSTATGLAVRIDGQNANGTLAGGVWTASVAPPAGRSYMAQVRLQQGAGLSSFLLAPVERRVDVPASGTLSVPFSSFAAPAAVAPTPTPTPAATPTARLVVNGPVGWRVGVGANGSNGTSLAYGALPASGSMALDLAPGTYALRVDTDRATGRLDAIDVPAGGRTIDARTWVPAFPAPTPTPPAPVDRGTQGPTSADPAKGTIVLRGAPGQAVVTIPAAGLSHTVDATGRPVALDVLPGTYGLTVTPVSDVQRVKSVVVVAGQTVEVVYGTMATPSAIEQDPSTLHPYDIAPVELMCGPVLNRAALPWAPATACPGNELTATDGTRWRALAATGGVTLAQLRADGTPTPASMGLGTKVLIVGVVAAAGYAGWMWWSHRKPSKGDKQENPGKCSCGG